MSRISNSEEALLEFRQARRYYEKNTKNWVQKIAGKYDPQVSLGQDDQALIEEHICSYLVTRFLSSLNWNRSNNWNDSLFVENMLREAPIRSDADRSRRRMDYLGFDRRDMAPLLLLEIKAPVYDLPSLRNRRPASSAKERSESIAGMICKGLQGQEITKLWQDWLKSTKDYVQSCHTQTGVIPKRVVMMNGRWMVLFEDPAKAFVMPDQCNSSLIHVYESLDDIEYDFCNVFRLLEHGEVLGPQKVQTIEIDALRIYLKQGDIKYALRGLLVNYDEVSRSDRFGPQPCIDIKPLLFLQTTAGSWFRIEARDTQRIPVKMPDLTSHLVDVQTASDELVTLVTKFDSSVEVKDITFHYQTLVSQLPGVREVPGTDGGQFELVLGREPHYICPVNNSQCLFHEPSNCGASIAMPEVRKRKTISPRSFFIAGEPHHCAHEIPKTTRSLPIIEPSDVPRSRLAGSAFCEIFPFEQRLCCRACAFENTCKQSNRFAAYPCSKA